MGLFAALVFKPAQFYAGRSGIYSVLGSINAVRALIAALKSAYEVEEGCPGKRRSRLRDRHNARH